ncbi:HlyD family secretion protein [Sulfurimonas paralvinellae]|uniref:HlyD family secretion protein n=1 Tax=Sulfurimonas paralvinellae TaxID=317658 RepID=A0A7M1B7D6_9BACT|nr:HlyD family secretion protein [Sulfurimonas paralvinellae]QOP45623.1 HlyD family secretion protein [Sulfurimonas paralvinellae]
MKYFKLIVKIIFSLLLFGSALYFGYNKYQDYFSNPWTRDGQVRAQVIQISPRVSGTVVSIPIIDNQFVKKGTLLFTIDPEPFEIKVAQTKAELKREKAILRGNKIEYERVKKIVKKDKGAVSQKDLIRHEVNYHKSLAKIDSLKEQLNTAKLNLTFTKVYASVDGYVSNINFQVGSQAVANQPILALVDSSSFWVFGFFRESMLGDININDKAKVTLMAYPNKPIDGIVESIGWGIATTDGNPGNNLLPSIKPVFQWIRLAQRVPVHIKLSKRPKDVALRFGLTASVKILHKENNK